MFVFVSAFVQWLKQAIDHQKSCCLNWCKLNPLTRRAVCIFNPCSSSTGWTEPSETAEYFTFFHMHSLPEDDDEMWRKTGGFEGPGCVVSLWGSDGLWIYSSQDGRPLGASPAVSQTENEMKIFTARVVCLFVFFFVPWASAKRRWTPTSDLFDANERGKVEGINLL